MVFLSLCWALQLSRVSLSSTYPDGFLPNPGSYYHPYSCPVQLFRANSSSVYHIPHAPGLSVNLDVSNHWPGCWAKEPVKGVSELQGECKGGDGLGAIPSTVLCLPQNTHVCLYFPKATFSFLYPLESGPLPVTSGSAHDPIEDMTIRTNTWKKY